MRKIKERGFTLVELLIVIALIAVLAAALVATLNPIEQVNKARDSRFKNDAAELLAAMERQYASTQAYPWMEAGTTYCSGGTTLCTSEDSYGAHGGHQSIGVCGATCSVDGTLIDSGELKPAFKSKDQFDSTATAIDKLYVYKEDEASGSVYVCFIPKAGTNRDPDKNPNLVLVDVCSAGDATGCTTFQAPVACASPYPTGTAWNSAGTACFICVPE